METKYTNNKTPKLIFTLLKCHITKAFQIRTWALVGWQQQSAEVPATGRRNKTTTKCLPALYDCHALVTANNISDNVLLPSSTPNLWLIMADRILQKWLQQYPNPSLPCHSPIKK